MTSLFLAIGNDKFGIDGGMRSGAVEAASLVMLGLIVLILGLVGAFVLMLARRTRRPDETLTFIEALPAEPPADEQAAPWEASADWWKRADGGR